MGKNGSFWSRITPYTETLLAGSYAGCLVAFLAAHYSPDETKGLVDALGQAIVLPLVIFVGVAAYLIYRQILG